MATRVGISPHRLWYERNVQMTIECPRLWRAYRRFWTTEAGWAPQYEETVCGDGVEDVPRERELHQTFDFCLPCIASFTKHATKQFPFSSRTQYTIVTKLATTISSVSCGWIRIAFRCRHHVRDLSGTDATSGLLVLFSSPPSGGFSSTVGKLEIRPSMSVPAMRRTR